MPSSLASGQRRRTDRSKSDATVSQISDQCGVLDPGRGGLLSNPRHWSEIRFVDQVSPGSDASRLRTALSILPCVVPSERSVSVAATWGEIVTPSLKRSITRGST